VRFERGEVRFAPTVNPPPGWLPAVVSVLSPGTELRRLIARETSDAGYMTIAVDGAMHDGRGGLVLAPVPHGASFPPGHPRALRAAAGVEIEVAAAGRFQLMAALGLNRLERFAALDSPMLVGSGPVAFGCALELHRRGAERILVLSARPDPAIRHLPGVLVVDRIEPARAHVVIDCSGDVAAGLRAVASGGSLCLLGTPDDDAFLPGAHLHRNGITVVGMHELAGYDHEQYQLTYTEVIDWLRSTFDSSTLRRWCCLVPETSARRLYSQLGGPDRPPQPFLLLGWSQQEPGGDAA
jgi:hypothetical protein